MATKSSSIWSPVQEKNQIQNVLKNIYGGRLSASIPAGPGPVLSGTFAAAYHAYTKTGIVVGIPSGSSAAITSQGNLTTWTLRTVNSYNFRAVASSDGGSPSIYGILVTAGDSGKIYSSGDAGSSWSANTSSGTETLYAVRYSSRLGMWIAVGANGVIRTCAVASPSHPTGVWATQSSPEANTWKSIAESPTRLIAVASTGTNRAMTSTNGTTWSSVSLSSDTWSSVTYSPYLDIFVATGNSNAKYSSDGLTWSTSTGGSNDGIAWIPELNMFLGSSSFSFDGINWLDYASGTTSGVPAYASHCGLVICATGSNSLRNRG